MLAPSRTRRPWHRLSAALAGLLTAFAMGAIGQPPGEVEDPKGGVKKKVVVEDDPVIVKPKGDTGPSTSPDVKLDELARAAEEATHPSIKELYLKHVYPFDRLSQKGGMTRIKPIPVARGERLPPQFGVQEVGRDGRIGDPQGINASEVTKIEYFEELVLAEANAVLAAKPLGTKAGPEGWTALDQLTAAEKVMAAALRFHDYARENPRERPVRKGRGWEIGRASCRERVREVRLLQLKYAVTVSDWLRVREIGSRLMLLYPKDAGVAAEVASARVLEAKRLLASEKHFDHVKARELLDEFEARY